MNKERKNERTNERRELKRKEKKKEKKHGFLQRTIHEFDLNLFLLFVELN